MNLRKWSVRAGLITSCLVACGGDDKPSSHGDGRDKPRGAAADGKVGNSDPDLSVAELNDAEWKAACLDIGTAGSSRELAHGPCILSGLLSSVVGLDCMDTYELCLDQPEDTSCDEKPADCTATLRELDACSVSQLVWLAEQTRDLDCSSSFSAILGIAQDHRTPECDAIEATCPSFKTAASQDDGSDF
jgi:hypothetical protein